MQIDRRIYCALRHLTYLAKNASKSQSNVRALLFIEMMKYQELLMFCKNN